MNLPKIPATVTEAIKLLSEEQKTLLFEQLKKQVIEIPTQPIANPSDTLIETENPWIKLAGKYQKDSQYDEVLAYIEQYRRELNSQVEDFELQWEENATVK